MSENYPVHEEADHILVESSHGPDVYYRVFYGGLLTGSKPWTT